MREVHVGPASALGRDQVIGAERWAVGDAKGERFAVTRRCRHMRGDLAEGSVDADGCLVCPWHGARYDVASGRMVSGPGGAFAKVPGLDAFYRAATKVVPLGTADVTDRDGDLYVT